MGAEENSRAPSVKKGLLKESLRSVFFALKSVAWQQWTSGLSCDDTRWGMSLQFHLFHSSGGEARRGGNKERKRWDNRGPIAITSYYSVPSEYTASCCPDLIPMKMKVHCRRDMASQSVLGSWQRPMVSLQLWHWQKDLNLSNLSFASWNGTSCSACLTWLW